MNKHQLKDKVEEAKTKVKEAKGNDDEAADAIRDEKENRRYIRTS